MIFEAIENLGYGEFAGRCLIWFFSAAIFVYILDRFKDVAKISVKSIFRV
jgi:hypothetical protein